MTMTTWQGPASWIAGTADRRASKSGKGVGAAAGHGDDETTLCVPSRDAGTARTPTLRAEAARRRSRSTGSSTWRPRASGTPWRRRRRPTSRTPAPGRSSARRLRTRPPDATVPARPEARRGCRAGRARRRSARPATGRGSVRSSPIAPCGMWSTRSTSGRNVCTVVRSIARRTSRTSANDEDSDTGRQSPGPTLRTDGSLQ